MQPHPAHSHKNWQKQLSRQQQYFAPAQTATPPNFHLIPPGEGGQVLHIVVNVEGCSRHCCRRRRRLRLLVEEKRSNKRTTPTSGGTRHRRACMLSLTRLRVWFFLSPQLDARQPMAKVITRNNKQQKRGLPQHSEHPACCL